MTGFVKVKLNFIEANISIPPRRPSPPLSHSPSLCMPMIFRFILSYCMFMHLYILGVCCAHSGTVSFSEVTVRRTSIRIIGKCAERHSLIEIR